MIGAPHSIALTNVEIDDEFWSPWMERNRDVTIEYQYEQLEDSRTLENFYRAANGKEGGFQGMWFQDSDAYKWLEAASYELAKREDPDLRDRVNEVIDLIADAQEESGYLNTYFQLVEPDGKWTNLHMLHELYCAGHLIEAAVAHHEATGESSLLDVATAFADHIDDVFEDEIDGVPGHEEIELALIKLYRVTGEKRYLDLAEYFINLRGYDDRLAWELEHLDEIAGGEFDSDDWKGSIHEGSRTVFLDDEGEYDGSYAQAHAPVREQSTTEGHSVRAMYLYAAVTELVAERGDDDLKAALDRLWANMTEKRMYITGGIGPEHEHEGFTEDYDLPNESAYAETCAAIGSIFWNQRMFELTEEAKYADLMERTLYNGFLAGIGLDGKHFFYVNPLASAGGHHRKGWFTCACCPPNAARLFASLGQYCYSTSGGELYVNQYVGGTLATSVHGVDVDVNQTSALPWDGDVTLEIDADDVIPVNLRIPEWCTEATVAVNGEEVDHDGSRYIRLDREWDGETIELDLAMEPELVAAHPAVESDAGRVAVERGPLVYCAEEVDNDRPLHQYAVCTDGDVNAAHREDLLGGVTVLEADADVPTLDEWEGLLYLPDDETRTESTTLTLVPYHSWDNRDPGAMQVWMRAG
ncbi:glycoside hydrolase family 127 protein [Haloprofundus halobius]|uniref:glycoside hydrolase family 127 protein n=1 Tax=Haloprofundus halobius TaxID=2876194 RepID=UPI001CCE26F4|nr:beta-L-arabinofuranosidase domain-containing protein [Haloprofundus halobius]